MVVSRLLVFASLLVLVTPALAQKMPYTYPRTVGTSPVQVLGENPTRKRLTFHNPNATAKIAFCAQTSRVDSSPITCAVNGAGAITLLPYAGLTVDSVVTSNSLPSAFNAVADTPGAAATILEFE
jgi:hypothetical protein